MSCCTSTSSPIEAAIRALIGEIVLAYRIRRRAHRQLCRRCRALDPQATRPDAPVAAIERGKGVPLKDTRGDLIAQLVVRMPDKPDAALAEGLRAARGAYSSPVREELKP